MRLSNPSDLVTTVAALLFLYSSPSAFADGENTDGMQLGEDVSSAIVRTESPWFEADPDTVKINGCDVEIEYVFANSCHVSDKVARSFVAFRLNDILEVELIEGSERTHFSFRYRPELKAEMEKAKAIVRAHRDSAAVYADDIEFALEATKLVDEFISSSAMSFRSTITYCNGAEVPDFDPVEYAVLFIDPDKARSLERRLEDYVEAYCPKERQG